MAAKDVQTVDYAFECDAPTFVDFAKLKRGELEEEDIDSWFGEYKRCKSLKREIAVHPVTDAREGTRSVL